MNTPASTGAPAPAPVVTRRVLVVGGVAGGASCAARLRRLDESCDIVVFDRGPFVSFANCGLPFYVGDVIEDERALLMASPELFRDNLHGGKDDSTEKTESKALPGGTYVDPDYVPKKPTVLDKINPFAKKE